MGIIKLIVLIIVLVSAYLIYDQRKQASSPTEQNITTLSAPSISCHHCQGLGKLIDDSGVKAIGYRCPICDGQGKIPAKKDPVCPHCKGFGKVPMKTATTTGLTSSKDGAAKSSGSNRMIAQRCPICEGIGIRPGTTR